ncbi:cation acetate symporter [uncultured Enterovirga sp.]|uniref:sodium:solute symporter family transporter n=1 Tax=uncultured Enterovirga sp. TaxID=2026352 RepID=UPI0035CB903D
MIRLAGGGLALLAGTGVALSQAATRTPQSGLNVTAIGLFVFFVAITLVITYWAAGRTRSAADYYTANGQVTSAQNGLALAGDLISAGAFLGLSGLIFGTGFDGLVYAVGYTLGYPLIIFFLADPLRRLGKYTFSDVIAFRLSPRPVRTLAALSSLSIVSFYLIAQLVGAGQLIQLLFGLPYLYAVLSVGILMICYVMFGGMVATTWVQIIKAVLLLCTATFTALLTLSYFGFSYDRIIAKAVEVHAKHGAILQPSTFAASPFSTLSLAVALFVGAAGLPHLLMRVFTVPDARAARNSMFWGCAIVAYFFSLIFIIGFGALAIVASSPEYLGPNGAPIGGGNMVAIHLSHALGGNILLGLNSAIGFATILAVVAGLTLAAASAVSHDLYASVLKRGLASDHDEVRVAKIATLGVGIVAVLLGIAFERQNIAYMVGLAFSISASSNFPVLILAMYWKGFTTRGAVIGGSVGLVSALLLTIVGPPVWVKVLGYAEPIFPLDPPTLITLPLALATCVLVSIFDRSAQAETDRAMFERQRALLKNGSRATAGEVPGAARA